VKFRDYAIPHYPTIENARIILTMEVKAMLRVDMSTSLSPERRKYN
jgi:hypothetical protein